MLRFNPSHLLLARIAEALGVASIATLAACGGKVVVDGTGSGGSGGGSTSTSSGSTSAISSGGTTSSTSTGPAWTCDKTPTGEGVEACIFINSVNCPPIGTEGLGESLSKAAGVCWDGSCGCCGMTAAQQVLCGPDPTKQLGTCCYILDVFPSGCCEGRPFTVEGVARTATLRGRSDWARTQAPVTSAIDDHTRRALASAWADEARFEHASIASFARLVLELVAVGAPPDLLSDAQQALADEITHAQLGFGLAAAYGAVALGPGPFDVSAASCATELVEVAIAAVREGCIGETVAALVAAEALSLAVDPAVVAALETIARDEAGHAASAYRLVAWALRVGGEPVREAVARAFAEPFHLPEAPEPEVDVAAFHAHGRLTPREIRAVAERALREVVAPSAGLLLG